MFSMLALALSLYAQPAVAVNPRCETVGPRLDLTMVTICDGSVVRVFVPEQK